MIDPVPSEWTQARLGDVAEILGGVTPLRNAYENWGGDIFWVTPSDLIRIQGRYISRTKSRLSRLGLVGSAATLLPVGSVLVTSRATIGACAINTVPMAASQGLQSLAPGPGVSAEFLLYVIRGHVHQLQQMATGSVFPEISRKSVADFSILLPPLFEQRKIAAILSSADEVIERTQAVIDQLCIVKKAMVDELLTRGLPGRHMRFKQTELGEVPKEWKIVRLDEVASLRAGIVRSKNVEIGRAVPCLQVTNVRDGYVDLSEVKTIFAEPNLVDRYSLRGGDVLFAGHGDVDEVGRSCVWQAPVEPCLHQNDVLVARVDSARLLPRFLAYWAATPHGKAYFLHCAKRTTSPASINLSQLKALSMPLASVEEQAEIVAIIDVVESRLRAERSFVSQVVLVKSSLMAVLIVGEVRFPPDSVVL